MCVCVYRGRKSGIQETEYEARNVEEKEASYPAENGRHG